MNDKTNEILIYAVGDIMLGDHPHYMGMGIGSRLRQGKTGDPFEHVKHILRQGDIVLGNLETVLSDVTARHGLDGINMRGDPSSARYIAEAGFNVISVANNHAMQHGMPAWFESIQNLRALGISVIGVEEDSVFLLECKGRRIAFLGFSLLPPQYKVESPPYCLACPTEVQEEIRRAKHKADIVILMVHWGDEYPSWPSSQQVRLGESFIRSGASLVIGHHPHVLQGVQKKGDGVIAYSLGNFVSDMSTRRCRETAILLVRLCNKGVKEFELLPIIISEDSRPYISGTGAKPGTNLMEKCNKLLSMVGGEDAEAKYAREVRRSVREFRRELLVWLVRNWQKYPLILLLRLLGRIVLRRLLLPVWWLSGVMMRSRE